VLAKLYAFPTPEELYLKFAKFVDISDLLFYKNIAPKTKKNLVFEKILSFSNLAPCPLKKSLLPPCCGVEKTLEALLETIVNKC
jgi:hypothetical protein